jgi:hypothetical protein
MEMTVVAPAAARRTWVARSARSSRIPIMCTAVYTRRLAVDGAVRADFGT